MIASLPGFPLLAMRHPVSEPLTETEGSQVSAAVEPHFTRRIALRNGEDYLPIARKVPCESVTTQTTPRDALKEG